MLGVQGCFGFYFSGFCLVFFIVLSTLTLEVLGTDICITKNSLYSLYFPCNQCKEILVLEYD